MGIPVAPAKTLRILVIDDESLVRWSLDEALTACGHTVLTAADGRAALGLLADGARDSDVVVLDYRLPGDDGLTLLPKIRALVPTARVVLLTSYGSADLEARAHALGAARVVHKPIDMDDVAGLVA
jgi:DNA-binding NtrC family response regulator